MHVDRAFTIFARKYFCLLPKCRLSLRTLKGFLKENASQPLAFFINSLTYERAKHKTSCIFMLASIIFPPKVVICIWMKPEE